MPDSDRPPPPPTEALDRLLPPDVRAASEWRHQAAAPVWSGVVWGRLGRGALAWAHWDRVRLPALQPWIAAERGRLLRELGLHAAAEALEWPALVRATDPIDAIMLRISLAADAVGVGDVERAQRRLDGAQRALEELGGLTATPRAARQRLRATWVAAEVAWLSGVTPSPRGLPRLDPATSAPVLPDDHAAGSDFHTAKGLLFGGVVHDEPRLLDAAADLAPPALAWAVHLARADRGREGAEAAARSAWQAIRPPPPYATQVREAPSAARLTSR